MLRGIFIYNIYIVNHDLQYVYYMWFLCKNLTIYIAWFYIAQYAYYMLNGA